ncbi:MAG: hypothetical protein IPK59_00675 [Rhodospirillaceae bacterium]|nr:hypothetical protein [Rhodospirillaceae bacterium]
MDEIAARRSISFKHSVVITKELLEKIDSVLNECRAVSERRMREDARKEYAEREGWSEEKKKEYADVEIQRNLKYQRVQWSIELADRTQLGPMTLGQVLAQSNLPGRRIERIEGEARSNSRPTIVMTFQRPKHESETCRYVVTGAETDVNNFSRRLDDIIAEARDGWTWLHRSPYKLFVSALVATSVVTFEITRESLPTDEEALNAKFTVWTILFFGILVCLPIGMTSLVDRIFPKSTYAIGHEVSRYATLKWLRWTILGGLVVMPTLAFFRDKLLSLFTG